MCKICIFDLSDDENAISEAKQAEDVQKIACQRKVKAQKKFVDLDVLCIEIKIEILILPITLSYIVRKLFDTCVFQQRMKY